MIRLPCIIVISRWMDISRRETIKLHYIWCRDGDGRPEEPKASRMDFTDVVLASSCRRTFMKLLMKY
jgi:hypothetical protein